MSRARFKLKSALATLATVLSCPKCGKKFYQSSLRLADSKQSKEIEKIYFLVHADCVSCGSSIILRLYVDEHTVLSFGMITDLNGAEVRALRQRSAISFDDVLNIHLALRGQASILNFKNV